MYEKLTKRVEQVIKLARSIARNADQEYLGTEHVLLAVCQEGTGVGAQVLNRLGVDEYRLQTEIDRHVKAHLEETWVFGRLPGSPHLKNVVANAIELAQQLGSKVVCTEHLLLAMVGEKGSIAGQALRKLGVTYEAAKNEILKIAAET